ncbi:Nucleotidyltransferase [Annulohypoxylon maeteangense]|uniref:Nucleotidyltransferase n=1 Tax=Annulohypoxylon maeteangense TaxID=1927788 RepID=UPI0020080A2D|nr:Nucleotidyltransferase [Annulohypoxylon maeteangense]KAI0881162.1 Nucleotidyltransferase [Annulohypoxylon maeteangense]
MPLQFPIIYLLPTHIDPDMLPEWESKIPTLTYDINEADVILGKISNRERAEFELRRRKIITEYIPSASPGSKSLAENRCPSLKRRKLSNSSYPKFADSPEQTSISDRHEVLGNGSGIRDPAGQKSHGLSSIGTEDNKSIIKVVRLAWFVDCLAQESILPMDEYLIYQGRKTRDIAKSPQNPNDIFQRATYEGGNGRPSSKGESSQHSPTICSVKHPALIQGSTSEHKHRSPTPPIPDYLHTPYSCQRPTPFNPPNKSFIGELYKVRTLRQLKNDEIGIRAYSTSIASLSAYPYLISKPSEVARLPGCSDKIAELYRQWKSNGCLEEAEDAKADPKMSVLQEFYGIWGVAATTSQEFYKKGWRDRDDIVENGWDGLTRVQQIGLKYYDELQEKISCPEAEEIGRAILIHTNKLRKGFQMVIGGGYRRGKTESGDVDVILSHPEGSATSNFIVKLVNSLESGRYITHTLIVSTKNSERGQTPVPWKGQGRKAGTGFDTLDKALVVWQNPDWDKKVSSNNPNPHRRVDIIISPWVTVGCAVIGWTGGITFERDLRRYCKREKSLKFDSSGVRSRIDGSWVDLESDANGPAPDMLTAERRVFKRLGLEWRPPEERCTG